MKEEEQEKEKEEEEEEEEEEATNETETASCSYVRVLSPIRSPLLHYSRKQNLEISKTQKQKETVKVSKST